MGKKKNFPSYAKAQKIVIENGIKSQREYKANCKKLGLPIHPERNYVGHGWSSFPEFCGNEKKPCYTYEEAQKIVIENGIKSQGEYKANCKKLGLPIHPERNYVGHGWSSWPEFYGKTKPISSSERKAHVLTSLSVNPILLMDDAPLKLIYMVASMIDKKVATGIEDLIHTTSYEEKLNKVNKQLKNLKADTATMTVTAKVASTDEFSAMESMLEVFEDYMGDLSEDITEYLNTIIQNYFHNAINKALIAEYDG